MPFPIVGGRTAAQNIADIAKFLNRWWVPRRIKQAARILFQQVDVVSTRQFYDVQALKAWRAQNDPTYTPTDPFTFPDASEAPEAHGGACWRPKGGTQ